MFNMKKKNSWCLVTAGKLMDHARNSPDITDAKDSTCMKCRELRNLQFQRINFGHTEYQESKKKVLHKDRDRWHAEKMKELPDKMEEFWKGKAIHEIKDDYVIPEAVVESDLDRVQRVSKGDLDKSLIQNQPLHRSPMLQRKGRALKKER